MNIELLSENATLPRPFMGYQLHSAIDVIVPAGGQALILTDLSITLPEDVIERVVTESRLQEEGLTVRDGHVLREGERRNVAFYLYQRGDQDYSIKAGDLVAQYILIK